MNNDELPVLTNFFLIPAKQLAAIDDTEKLPSKSDNKATKSDDNNKHISSLYEMTARYNKGDMYVQSLDALIYESNKGDAQHV